MVYYSKLNNFPFIKIGTTIAVPNSQCNKRTVIIAYRTLQYMSAMCFEWYSKPYIASRSLVWGTRWRYGRICSTAPSIPTSSASSAPSSVPTSWGPWSDLCFRKWHVHYLLLYLLIMRRLRYRGNCICARKDEYHLYSTETCGAAIIIEPITVYLCFWYLGPVKLQAVRGMKQWIK